MSSDEEKQKDEAAAVTSPTPPATDAHPASEPAEADPWGPAESAAEAREAAESSAAPEERAEDNDWLAAAEPAAPAPDSVEPGESLAAAEAPDDPWGATAEPEPSAHVEHAEVDEDPAEAGEPPEPHADAFESQAPQAEPEPVEAVAPEPETPAATVFAPRMTQPPAEPPPPVQDEPAHDAPAHDAPAETVFMPSGGSAGPAYAPPPAPDSSAFDAFSAPPSPAAPPPASEPPLVQPGATMFNVGRVEIGTVLSDNYQIKRLISRGGMGEVYEGFNIHNERDRVAIKVMLPALAADPNVMTMFMKEAGILSGIEHPGVVGYRGINKDQKLNVFYMVMGFIDGIPLGDMLARLKPTSQELRALTRRLAEGLRAAHNVGAIHRDISPDNVLLPGGRLEDAKIIDFGIAKDMDPSKATVIGDGFAGKLGYVAPEQMGAFDRQVGPWTDVYSLGLVILTVAAGKSIDMGATLMDAVNKRNSVPDLSAAPADIQPILTRMLEPDPAKRFRSMSDLLAALDGAPMGVGGTTGGGGGGARGGGKTGGGGTADPRSRLTLMIGGGVAAALVLVIGLVLMLTMMGKPSGGATGGTTVAAGGAGPATHAEAVRRAIEAALPTIPCAWIDLDRVTDAPGGGGVEVKLTGVAGSTSAVQGAVSKAITATGATVADFDTNDVSPVGQVLCSALDAYAPFRAKTSATGRRLKTEQIKYMMSKGEGGTMQGTPVIEVQIGDPSLDLALVGIQETATGTAEKDKAGAMAVIINGRQDLAAILNNPAAKAQFSATGDDSYRLTPIMPNPGWSAVVLLTGKGPFDAKLLETGAEHRDAAWQARLKQAAQAGGWKAEMAWFQLVSPSS